MSRRIDLELTSARPDGTWTWRAAGAREPKGVLDGALLPGGAKVGDVLKAEAEFDLDGIAILQVFAGKGGRKEPERLELIASKPFEPVTQTLAERTRGDRGPRGDRDRGDRGDRPRRGPRPEGDRGPARDGQNRPPRGPRPPRAEGAPQGDRPARRDRPPRPPVPELPSRPKPKRLRAGRTHRNALLASLPDDHKVIAEQVLRGGVPAVRQALQEQNAQLKAAGQPEIKPGGLLALAEELLPKVRVAEWLDRAEGAAGDLDELDLRDLRSVVAAAGDPVVARDSATHELAEQLKQGLTRRQDAEHEQWLGDIDAALEVGRLVRALRLSSRPPKAGVRFPAEVGQRLVDATVASLGPDASGERWVAVLDALAYSPIRSSVKLTAPANPPAEVTAAVTRLAGLLPEVATAFGITPPPAGARSPRPPRPGRPQGATGKAGAPKRNVPPPPPSTPVAPPPAAEATDAPATDAPVADAPVADAPVADAPVAEAPIAEAPVADAPVADGPVAEAEAPAGEAPAADAPAPDAPAAETEAAPAADAPAVDTAEEPSAG